MFSKNPIDPESTARINTLSRLPVIFQMPSPGRPFRKKGAPGLHFRPNPEKPVSE